MSDTGGQVPPRLIFHCQQAHGSPTGIISNFNSVKELYQRIAECYGVPSSDILFCTLNTHKVDMGHLLGSQLDMGDFVFAHMKGRAKELELEKEETSIGLTITDNGAGRAFVKRIKEGSHAERLGLINVGDVIERINDEEMTGQRHFDVAKALRQIARGNEFTIRLIEPLKSGFSEISFCRSKPSTKSRNINSGMETLRLKAKGPAVVEKVEPQNDDMERGIEKINDILESFMGISDTELAHTIWDISVGRTNPHDFIVAMEKSELAEFSFPEDFLFDLWGVITDIRSGRLRSAPSPPSAASPQQNSHEEERTYLN